MKYIVYDNKLGDELVIMFDDCLTHKGVAMALGLTTSIVSAGSLVINEHNVVCYGESITLMVGSRKKEDIALIKRAIGWDQ